MEEGRERENDFIGGEWHFIPSTFGGVIW